MCSRASEVAVVVERRFLLWAEAAAEAEAAVVEGEGGGCREVGGGGVRLEVKKTYMSISFRQR